MPSLSIATILASSLLLSIAIDWLQFLRLGDVWPGIPLDMQAPPQSNALVVVAVLVFFFVFLFYVALRRLIAIIWSCWVKLPFVARQVSSPAPLLRLCLMALYLARDFLNCGYVEVVTRLRTTVQECTETVRRSSAKSRSSCAAPECLGI